MLVGPPREYTPVYKDCIATATKCNFKCNTEVQPEEDMVQQHLQKLVEAKCFASALTVRAEQFSNNTATLSCYGISNRS